MAQEIYVVTEFEDGYDRQNTIGMFTTKELAIEVCRRYIEHKRKEAINDLSNRCRSYKANGLNTEAFEATLAKVHNFTYDIQEIFEPYGVDITDLVLYLWRVDDLHIECSIEKVHDEIPDFEELRP